MHFMIVSLPFFVTLLLSFIQLSGTVDAAPIRVLPRSISPVHLNRLSVIVPPSIDSEHENENEGLHLRQLKYDSIAKVDSESNSDSESTQDFDSENPNRAGRRLETRKTKSIADLINDLNGALNNDPNKAGQGKQTPEKAGQKGKAKPKAKGKGK